MFLITRTGTIMLIFWKDDIKKKTLQKYEHYRRSSSTRIHLETLVSCKFINNLMSFYAPIHSRHLEHLERQRLHLHQILQHKLSVDLLFFPTCPLKFLGRLCSQTGPDGKTMIRSQSSVIRNQ